MRSSAKTYTITEYEGFVRGGISFGKYQALPTHTFDALESFILAKQGDTETNPIELLSMSARRGVGKIITARNYVGLITMKDGTVIEILPKIHNAALSKGDTKRIFLEMLRTLKNVAFKSSNISSLNTDRQNLFEIFISMFLSEVTMLVKQGLKSSYKPVQHNEPFFKGKMNVPQNIKYNYANRAKFCVNYDEWSMDRPENRLLKATLCFLQKQTGDSGNRLTISRLLNFFDGVDISLNHQTNFARCIIGRNTSHYEKALSWCRVFLQKNSFTSFAGSEVALALLFPMEQVFERYVASKLSRFVPSNMDLHIQDKRYSLFDHPRKAFYLRPDIVLTGNNMTVVMDTKWKLLSENSGNYGISQSDMYQMYVYGKKYSAAKVLLVYPQTANVHHTNCSFYSEDGILVEIAFLNLLQIDQSIAALLLNSTSQR